MCVLPLLCSKAGPVHAQSRMGGVVHLDAPQFSSAAPSVSLILPFLPSLVLLLAKCMFLRLVSLVFLIKNHKVQDIPRSV